MLYFAGETLESSEKFDFDQGTACGAPYSWSKYTTVTNFFSFSATPEFAGPFGRTSTIKRCLHQLNLEPMAQEMDLMADGGPFWLDAGELEDPPDR